MPEKPERTAQAQDVNAEAGADQVFDNTGEANAPAAESPNDDVGRLEAELEAAKAQAAESSDKYLRALADMENARRRAEIDLANAHKYAIERFAGELLAVRDGLELARTVDIPREDDNALQKMHEGLDLTLKLMDDAFRKFNLTIIDPTGAKFDPEKHHAISLVASDEVPPNHVVSVMQKGCLLHDRVLRPAMVVVARAPSAPPEGSPSENP